MSAIRTYTHAPWEKHRGCCRAICVGEQACVTATASVNENGGGHAVGDAYRQRHRCVDILDVALNELSLSSVTWCERGCLWPTFWGWLCEGGLRGGRFGEFPSATSMVQVKSLPYPDMLVGVEADVLCGA